QLFERRQRFAALVAINVEHPYARAFAGREADVEIARSPPAGDDVWIGGRALLPLGDRRFFAALDAWENPHAFGGESEGVVAELGHAAASLNASGACSSTAAITACENASRTALLVNSITGV